MKTLLKSLLLLCLPAAAGAQTLQEAIKLTENERFAKANKIYLQLITQEPANGDYYFYFSNSLLKSEDLDSARIIAEKGVAMNASNPLAVVGLGRVNWYTGKTVEGTKNFSDAKQLLQTQSKQIPAPRQATVYTQIAEAYIKGPMKNLEEATALLAVAEKLNNKDPEIYMLRGDLLAQDAMKGAEAIKQYEKARTLNPKLCIIDYRIGILWINAKNMPLAVEAFDRAVACDSTFAPSYSGRAEALYRAGRTAEAIRNYEKYLQLNSGDPDAMGRYASFLYLSKDYKRALDVIYEVQKKDSSSVVLYRVRGYSEYETGEHEKALRSMQQYFQKQALKGKPYLIAADYEYRGKAFSKMKQDSLGLIDIKKAYEMDSSRKDLLIEMGKMNFNMKKYAEAEKFYLRKMNAPGGKPNVNDYFGLGRVYLGMNAYGKADTAFQKVIESSPDLLLGYQFRARAVSGLDPESKQGLAKPHYELLLEKAMVDKVKAKKEVIEASEYLGAYNFLVAKNYGCAKYYYQLIQELDANNVKAKTALNDPNLKKAVAPADASGCK